MERLNEVHVGIALDFTDGNKAHLRWCGEARVAVIEKIPEHRGPNGIAPVAFRMVSEGLKRPHISCGKVRDFFRTPRVLANAKCCRPPENALRPEQYLLG
ncbi:MAG: hypothetical protein ACOVMP_02875 [Chthoniobacterales bacterium]